MFRPRRWRPPKSRHPSAPGCAVCGASACLAHCWWCGIDMETGTHPPDCPEVTNVYPVGRGEEYHCLRCDAPLAWGSSYSLIEGGDGVAVVTCLGCAARVGLHIV